MSQISKCPKVIHVLTYWDASVEVSEPSYKSLLYFSSNGSYCSWGDISGLGVTNDYGLLSKDIVLENPIWGRPLWKLPGYWSCRSCLRMASAGLAATAVHPRALARLGDPPRLSRCPLSTSSLARNVRNTIEKLREINCAGCKKYSWSALFIVMLQIDATHRGYKNVLFPSILLFCNFFIPTWLLSVSLLKMFWIHLGSGSL